jgi:hypothetical protein
MRKKTVKEAVKQELKFVGLLGAALASWKTVNGLDFSPIARAIIGGFVLGHFVYVAGTSVQNNWLTVRKAWARNTARMIDRCQRILYTAWPWGKSSCDSGQQTVRASRHTRHLLRR